MGAQGDQGDQGAQGFQGFQGAQGTQGTQGDQGAQGDQGFQGAQGAQGDAGVQSVNGDTGVVVLDASDVGAIPTTEKAAANGVATLGATSILVQNTNYAFRYTPEGYYCRDAAGTANGRQFGTSTSYVLLNPVMIWSDIAIDRLAMNVVTNGGALSTYRICLYKVSEGSDVINQVVNSEVLFDTTTNGVKISTVDLVLTKGLYMIACLNQTGATDVIYTAATGKTSYAYRHADRIFSLTAIDAIRLGGTFTGALPSTLTLAPNNNLFERPALIFFRIKP
jgi:hypothetical protein